MTAPVRDVPPWLAAVLPGLRGDRLTTPAVAEVPPALLAATITTPATPIPTGVVAQLFGAGPKFRRTLPDLMASIPMSGGLLQVPTVVPGANGATSHAEGFPKTEADLTFAGGTSRAASVATWIGITDELLEDVPGLNAWLQLFLGQLVKQAEERAILQGNGIATPIVGFMLHPDIPEVVPGAYNVPGMVTEMIAQATLASGIVPDTIVIASNIYVGLSSGNAVALDYDGRTFAGCDVIVSPALTAGQVLVGPVQALSVIGREGTTIIEGTRSHVNDFVQNKAAIRAASRLALGVLMPTAFVRKSALDGPGTT